MDGSPLSYFTNNYAARTEIDCEIQKVMINLN